MNKTYTITALLLFLTQATLAQQDTLSFREAVRIALDQNIALKQQKNDIDYLHAQKQQNQFWYLPDVGISTGGNITTGRQFDETTGQVNTQTGEYMNVGVNASLPLFEGFRNKNNLQRSRHQLQAQQYRVADQKQQTIFQVANQYLQVLLDRALLDIARQNLQAQKTQLEQTQGMVEAGIEDPPARYTQEAEVKRQEVEVIQARKQLRMDEAMLFQTLQMEQSREIALKTPQWKLPRQTLNEDTLATWYQMALNHRQDLQQLQAEVNAATSAMDMVKGQYLPSLSVSYNYGSRYSSFQQRDWANQMVKDNLSSGIGVSLYIPVFQGFAKQTELANARITLEDIQWEQKALKQEVYREINQVYWEYRSAMENYEANKARVQAAENAREKQEELYDLGEGDLVALSLANRDLVEAQSDLARARYTLLFQKLMVRYYTGRLEPDNYEGKI